MCNPFHASYLHMAKWFTDRHRILVVIPYFKRTSIGWARYSCTFFPLHILSIFLVLLGFFTSVQKRNQMQWLYCLLGSVWISVLMALVFCLVTEDQPSDLTAQRQQCVETVKWTQTQEFRECFGIGGEKPAQNVFLMGYSSGGWMVPLLAHDLSDTGYLKGCICACGLYTEDWVKRWPFLIWFFWSQVGIQDWKTWIPIYSDATKPDNQNPIPMLLITGSKEAPTLLKSTWKYKHHLHQVQPNRNVHVLVLPDRDHWTVLTPLKGELETAIMEFIHHPRPIHSKEIIL